MSAKPIFVATHPRACSTAFERVFMTRRDILQCVHEPFGEAFYYGPERLSERFENDSKAREESGHSKTTYRDIMGELLNPTENKRVFIKDMAQYLMPAEGRPAKLAPSLCQMNDELDGTTIPGTKRTEPGNPTVVPFGLLSRFHFTFLIRHPRRSIPSYYRCTIPPLDDVTGFYHFLPNEAGYLELRELFDYLRSQGLVGPGRAGEDSTDANTSNDGVNITVLDADDLLDQPEEIIEAFCGQVGVDFRRDMLSWDNDEDQAHAQQAFAKWDGFHDDVIQSSHLKPRTPGHGQKKTATEESENEEWREKYGEEAQKIIRTSVDENIPHYEYLKSFALRF